MLIYWRPQCQDCAWIVSFLPVVCNTSTNVPALLRVLLKLLTPGGEIHIIDTPVYEQGAATSAKERSSAYFEKQGVTSMQSFYYHHTWEVFRDLNCTVLYDPGSWLNRLRRRVSDDSPFPWIRITS